MFYILLLLWAAWAVWAAAPLVSPAEESPPNTHTDQILHVPCQTQDDAIEQVVLWIKTSLK